MRDAVPVILDVAGFLAITIGAALIWAPAGWIAAGLGLVMLGLRFSE